MMRLIDILNKFQIKNNLIESDNFQIYECSFTSKISSGFKVFKDSVLYDSFNKTLNEHSYEWVLSIDEVPYRIDHTNFIDLKIDEEFEDVSVKIQIFKKSNTIQVFNQEVFYDYLKSENLSELLYLFAKYVGGIKFLIPQNSFGDKTPFLTINDNDFESNLDSKLIISPSCHFSNLAFFKFTPLDFELHLSSNGNYLVELFNKLNYIFILIFLSDFTEIQQNKILIKILGYKTFSYELDFQKLNYDSLNEYRKIFKWVYSEKSKIEDKVSIARNILTIYLKDDSPKIDDKVFPSILSANKAYIKDNISRYIDIRNKLHNQLEKVTEEINKAVHSFFSNFQKSIFTFISFYLTIFVLKIYTKPNIESLLNKETTYTSTIW